jgi:hypothetical protein
MGEMSTKESGSTSRTNKEMSEMGYSGKMPKIKPKKMGSDTVRKPKMPKMHMRKGSR